MEFQVAGIGILLLFYGCYIVKMMAQRKQGIRTDQMGRGKSGSAKRIELAVKAAAYGAFFAASVSVALDTGRFAPSVRIAGAIAGGAGAAVFAVSVLTMKDSWRAGVSRTEETTLVTEGVYQISRNPAFLGFDLVYLGIGVMFFNWVLFAASVLAAVTLHLQIVHVEEPFLEETFGETYAEYRKGVCRYLGRRRR